MIRKTRFNKSENLKNGFTLIELMIVMGLSSILFGLIIFNLGRFQNSSTQHATTDSLVSDIRNQQSKAMLGDTEGGIDSSNYGIYFYADRYILFRGDTFNSNDPNNFEIELPPSLSFQSTSFPGNQIVFEKLSGEITGFTPGSDSVTVRAININRDFVITINRYGVIAGIN
jgi:prepilin-type N-terminal cleavage/methylation domain-containing protein